MIDLKNYLLTLGNSSWSITLFILYDKLKKSKILKLVGGDDAKADMLEEYAKRNDLSFKKENDVQKILDYSAKN